MLSLFKRNKEEEVECLNEIYKKLGEKPPDAFEETNGADYGIRVKNCIVIVENSSSRKNMRGYRTAFARCIDECGAKTMVTHGPGEMKKGSTYRISGNPIIRHWGTMDVINELPVKGLSTSQTSN